MKNLMVIFSLMFSLVTFAGQKEDAVSLAKRGLSLIKSAGEAGAFKQLSDSKGKYINGSLYVFVIDFNGKVLSHIKPNLIGKNLLGLKDKNGKAFTGEFVNVAKNSGTGWVDYMWPKPNEKKPSLKTSYIERVPGKDYFVGVGYYK